MKLSYNVLSTVVKPNRSKALKLDDDTFVIYQNEPLSIEAFKKFRTYEGIACKKCSCEEYYWLATKEQFQCKKCKFRTTLRSGTVLENSKLPFSYLYIAVHLLLKTGNKLTPEQLQHFTGHKYYEPLWYLLRKIKEEMNPAQQTLLLLSFIEVVQSNLSSTNFIPVLSLPKN